MKRKMRVTAAVSFAVCLLTSAGGQTPASAPRALGGISDFAWLQGLWTGELGGAKLEQYFSPVTGGLILGEFRLVKAGQPPLLEFALLRETPQGVELRLRHFDPSLKPMEGVDPILLRLTAHDSSRFAFENPINGQPKRSTLERNGDALFHARSEIVGDLGRLSSIELDWRRRSLEPVPAGSDAPPNRLTDFAWFAGHWVSPFGKGPPGKNEVHEFWLAPAANVMAGILCQVRDGQAEGIEFSSLEPGKDAILGHTWQFEPEMKISGQQHTIEAQLVSGAGDTAEFRGTVQDSTFREKVERPAPDRMHKRLEIFKPDGTTLGVIELNATRVAARAAAGEQGGSR